MTGVSESSQQSSNLKDEGYQGCYYAFSRHIAREVTGVRKKT
ncbi:hypothetical protein ACK3F5_18825 [Photorhabdus asymbiotica UENP]